MNSLSLLFLTAVSLWGRSTCQERSLQLRLSANTSPTNSGVSTSITEGGSLRLCFAPTATPTSTSVVSVKTKDGTAQAPEDYTALDADLTFTDADPQCVWFYANLDVEDENSETFTIQAAGTSGDYSNVNIEVTVTINNQGMQGPTFSVEYDNYPVVESADEVEVCVAYYGSQTLASTVTVQLRTDDNPVFPGQSPASAGSDYTPESDNLTFPAGSTAGTRRCIAIKIITDNNDENEETIQLQLTTQSTATLGPHTSATVRITETGTVTPDGDNNVGGGNGTVIPDGDNNVGGGNGTVIPDGDNNVGGGNGTVIPDGDNNVGGGNGTVTPDGDNNVGGGNGTVTPDGDNNVGGGGDGIHNPYSVLRLLILVLTVTVIVLHFQ